MTDTVHLHDGDHKLWLLYGGYSSHQSVFVLDIFAKNNIISYTFPAHTSGTTRRLDVGVFGPVETYFRDTLDSEVHASHGQTVVFNEFFVARVINNSHRNAFAKNNIISAFRLVGICLLDEVRLFARAQLSRVEDLKSLTSVDMMISGEDKLHLERGAHLTLPEQVLPMVF